MKENKNNNRIVAYFSTSSSTSGGHLPSLLDTTTDVDSKVSSSQQQKKRKKNKTRRRQQQQQQQRCSKVFDILKRLIVYAIALAAIASSILSIFSCNFFSYTDSAVATDGVDGFTSALENDENETLDLGYQYTPFEFMNEAGVGLFAYYMGDPFAEEGSILYKQEPMCFLYCDELHDFYWFYNNYNPNNKGLLSRKIDLWIVARYCSIMAPSVALWGLLQLIVVENWCCGYRINRVTHETAKVASSLFLFMTFLAASLIQFGTFSIMFASPNLSSPSQSDGTTYQDSFCLSTTTSKYLCQLDTGGFYSLGSGLVYLVLAVYSSLSTYSTTTTTQSSTATDDGNDDGQNNNTENTDDTNNTRSLVCCGGCCLRRGDGNSSSGTNSSSRKGGINNNTNNNDDQKVVSSNRNKRTSAGDDAKEKSDTSDSSHSSSNSTSTSKLISKLSYQNEEEHNDRVEQKDDAEDDVRSGGASFSFFGSEITF